MIDFNKHYMVSSTKIEDIDILDNSVEVECKIELCKYGKGAIKTIPIDNSYKSSIFLDTYFEWLLYTKFIKVIE